MASGPKQIGRWPLARIYELHLRSWKIQRMSQIWVEKTWKKLRMKLRFSLNKECPVSPACSISKSRGGKIWGNTRLGTFLGNEWLTTPRSGNNGYRMGSQQSNLTGHQLSGLFDWRFVWFGWFCRQRLWSVCSCVVQQDYGQHKIMDNSIYHLGYNCIKEAVRSHKPRCLR